MNDLLLLISAHDESGTVWLYDSPALPDAAQAAQEACDEVLVETPLGAYALERLTYTVDEGGRGYTQLRFTAAYRRTAQQIKAIVHTTSMAALTDLLRAVEQNKGSALTVQVSGFDGSREAVLTAVAAVQQAYPEPETLEDVPPFDGGTETAVELLVRNQAVDNTIAVEDVRTRMEEQYPLAVPAFEQALADTGVERNDRVTVSPARMKKLESRSFKTESGIEIKIPAELCNSDEAVEFIHSATGGLSLLIKDVLV